MTDKHVEKPDLDLLDDVAKIHAPEELTEAERRAIDQQADEAEIEHQVELEVIHEDAVNEENRQEPTRERESPENG